MSKLVCLILILGFSLKATALQVMLDPGHGGYDNGTSLNGIKEKDLVLKVSGYLRSLLESDPQFSVTQTRTADQHVSLQDRVRKAEQAQADLFVSLHVNSNPDARAHGVELYFQNSLPPDEESLLLADQENQQESSRAQQIEVAPSKKNDILAIVDDLHRQYRAKSSLLMTQLLQWDWRQVSKDPVAIKQAPFFVVSRTTMPAVLIEIGFLTHPEESHRLTSPKYQQEIAQKIYKALVHYKEKVDKIDAQALE